MFNKNIIISIILLIISIPSNICPWNAFVETIFEIPSFIISFFKKKIISSASSDTASRSYDHESLHRRIAVLEKNLRMMSHLQFPFKTVQVLGVHQGPFFHVLYIEKIEENDELINDSKVVYHPHGLIGSIISKNRYFSTVMLITDQRSHVPIQTIDGKSQGILKGSGDHYPHIITESGQFKVGDAIETSGIGGIFMKQYPVGIVESIKDHKVFVKPYVNPKYIDIIFLIDGLCANDLKYFPKQIEVISSGTDGE